MLKPLQDLLLQLLNFFNQYVHNYGIAIILLTITVRILLLPLTIKQTRSLQAMQKIQPKLKKLQEKYKDDKEKLQKEMMKFYAENKVNPLSGCLPLLLQLPIFFALFRMLLGNKALQKASFLVIPSLSKSAGDFSLAASQAIPYDLLIILMVATTYYSQKMITTDPQQARMMVPMTLLMAFIAWRLPAGILIYWVTTNIWTIVQQYVTLRAQPKTTTS
jgi:YidC/Oxa1 family membrane protein insertase